MAEAETKTVIGVQTDALAAVTNEWETPVQIHNRVGMWAYESVRHQLMELMRAGTIESKIEPTGNGDQCRRLFRLKQSAGT